MAGQRPDEWPASIYGHLKGDSLTFQMLTFERISWFDEKGIDKYQIRYTTGINFLQFLDFKIVLEF